MNPRIFYATFPALLSLHLASCAAAPTAAPPQATDTTLPPATSTEAPPTPSATVPPPTATSAPTRTPHPSLEEAALQPGHTAFTFRTESGESVDYLLYLPENYDPAMTWPLIVFLHGGVGTRENIMTIFVDSLPELAGPESELPFIVVSPLLPEGFWPSYLDRVEELIEHLLVSLPVDARRMYLTGFSSCSYGAWRYAMSYPDRFTAVAPVSAGPSLLPTDPVSEGICQLRELPIYAFHSEGRPRGACRND
jgi:predicted peptidase